MRPRFYQDTGIRLNKVKTSLAPPISQDNMVAAIRQDSVVKAKTYNVGEGKMLVRRLLLNDAPACFKIILCDRLGGD